MILRYYYHPLPIAVNYRYIATQVIVQGACYTHGW